MFLRGFILFFLSAYVALNVRTAEAADPIRCNCFFEQTSGYVGVGTRAACSTLTEKNKGKGETCQVAFGATGYEEQLLSKLALDPKRYREMVFSMTMLNLAAVHDRAPQKFTSEFLRNAIPAYMRAVYLRSEAGLDDKVLVDLDKEVNGVSAEYSQKIADVFLGKAIPFEAVWNERHRLTVQRGSIKFVYAGQIILVTVFFDPEQI